MTALLGKIILVAVCLGLLRWFILWAAGASNRLRLVLFAVFLLPGAGVAGDWDWHYEITSGSYVVSDGSKTNMGGFTGSGRDIFRTWSTDPQVSIHNDSGAVIVNPTIRLITEGTGGWSGPELALENNGELATSEIVTVPGGDLAIGETRVVSMPDLFYNRIRSSISTSTTHIPRAAGGVASAGSFAFSMKVQGSGYGTAETWYYTVDWTANNNSLGTSSCVITPTGTPSLATGSQPTGETLTLDWRLDNSSGGTVTWTLTEYVDSVPITRDTWTQDDGDTDFVTDSYEVEPNSTLALTNSVGTVFIYDGSGSHVWNVDGATWEGWFQAGESNMFQVRFSMHQETTNATDVDVFVDSTHVGTFTVPAVEGEHEFDFDVPAPTGSALLLTTSTSGQKLTIPPGSSDPLLVGTGIKVFRRYVQLTADPPPDTEYATQEVTGPDGVTRTVTIEHRDNGDGTVTATLPSGNSHQSGNTLADTTEANTTSSVTGNADVVNTVTALGLGGTADAELEGQDDDAGVIADALDGAVDLGEALGTLKDRLADAVPDDGFFDAIPQATVWPFSLPATAVTPAMAYDFDLTHPAFTFLRLLIMFAATVWAVKFCVALVV